MATKEQSQDKGDGRAMFSARLNESLIDEIKIIAIKSRKKTYIAVEEAIKDYVEKHKNGTT
jgi:predicted transcriptional regulator